MKMKLNLGEGGIKGFLARHVEKIVLGLAVLVVVWVALPDGETKPIDTDVYGAEAITQAANSATTKLSTETAWPLIKSERFKTPDEYLARAERSLIHINRDGYPAETPLDKPLFPMDLRRSDPKIYTVEKIEVAVSYGPVVAPEEKTTGRLPPRRVDPIAADGRPLPPEVMERLSKFGAASARGGKVEGKYIVSIMGQVPVKRQIAEYKAVFEDAADYQESRDFPNYGAGRETEYGKYYYMVQRAEISPDGTEGEWKTIGDSYRARKTVAGWLDSTELVDEKYVDPIWTMKLPPLLMRDLRPLALHSEVPSAAQAAEAAAEPEEVPEKDPMDGIEGPLADDLLAGDVGESPRTPLVGRPRGGEGSFGEGGSAVAGAEDVEYKLFRYFDMDVQPGKSYVYRVKLYIEDPNDPAPPTPKPPLRVLEKSVIERLAKKAPEKPIWWRESDFSQVSAVVRVPATKQVLAGAVLPPGTPVKEPDKTITTRLTEAEANIMALVWDESKATDVPGIVRAPRGTVLNFTADVEAIDVAGGVLKKHPLYAFTTNNIVLDLRGGESLGKKSDLSSPGEVLLIDDAGNLVVRRELDDRATFVENYFPPEPKAAATTIEPEDEGDDRRRTTRPPRPSSSEGGSRLLD